MFKSYPLWQSKIENQYNQEYKNIFLIKQDGTLFVRQKSGKKTAVKWNKTTFN